MARLNFAIGWGWTTLKNIFSEPSMLLGDNFLRMKFLLAGYITSLDHEEPRGRKPLISLEKSGK